MGTEETITQTTERRQLIWYGHFRRMDDVRLPKIVWKWRSSRGRQKGRSRRTWDDNAEEP